MVQSTTASEQIIREILEYIRKGGGAFSDWYVGISQDARTRLFSGHSVNENGDHWIYRQASSSKAAREIEEYFLNRCHTSGGPGGGDDTTDMVYAYKMNAHTTE
jgi:hypothetical protein